METGEGRDPLGLVKIAVKQEELDKRLSKDPETEVFKNSPTAEKARRSSLGKSIKESVRKSQFSNKK